MEILKTISVFLLLAIDVMFMICCILANIEEDKIGAIICLLSATYFAIPTIYIIFN